MPDKNISDISENTWTTDFIKQAAEQFEENLQNFIQNGKFYNLKKDVRVILLCKNNITKKFFH